MVRRPTLEEGYRCSLRPSSRCVWRGLAVEVGAASRPGRRTNIHVRRAGAIHARTGPPAAWRSDTVRRRHRLGALLIDRRSTRDRRERPKALERLAVGPATLSVGTRGASGATGGRRLRLYSSI
jgi:hypothetical protein